MPTEATPSRLPPAPHSSSSTSATSRSSTSFPKDKHT
uniref:Uncharacterized protein n=1 Tax=Siphoviridae sp. ctBLh2 TaxID=2827803 RepID=A0A8S5S3R7_9CAUD|nr:MAG TPA: hypothetical protein [Siphoviridae sp. ctBLh2]